MTLFPNDTAELWVYLTFTSFLLLSAWFIWISIVWKVQVEGENIQFRNCLFQTRKFTFKSIDKVKILKLDEIILYSKDGKKLLHLSPIYSGFRGFMERLKQEKIEFE